MKEWLNVEPLNCLTGQVLAEFPSSLVRGGFQPHFEHILWRERERVHFEGAAPVEGRKLGHCSFGFSWWLQVRSLPTPTHLGSSRLDDLSDVFSHLPTSLLSSLHTIQIWPPVLFGTSLNTHLSEETLQHGVPLPCLIIPHLTLLPYPRDPSGHVRVLMYILGWLSPDWLWVPILIVLTGADVTHGDMC